MLVDGKDASEYLCPVCRDRAMVHMLGELQVTRHYLELGLESTHATINACNDRVFAAVGVCSTFEALASGLAVPCWPRSETDVHVGGGGSRVCQK